MLLMNSEKQFKLINKNSTCTKRPWEYLIPQEDKYAIILKVRQECVEIYGHDFSECSKRKVCFTKKCMGRELEWKSPTALPYLKEFAKMVGINEGDEYFIQTDCSSCPIYNTCKSTCFQISDYINRDKSLEPKLVYKETVEQYKEDNSYSSQRQNLTNLQIPWDCLPERKAAVIKKYLYQQKDFLSIAKELDLNNQARAKYEFYSALTTLSEVAVMRKFIEDKNTVLDAKQLAILKAIYLEGKTLTEVSEQCKISKQAVQQLIARLVAKYNLKWAVFVKKQGSKLIYNVPEILK